MRNNEILGPSEQGFSDIRIKLGFIMFKPDAVAQDLIEYLVEHTRQEMLKHAVGDLYGVHIVKIDRNQAPEVYPDLDMEGNETVYQYISSDNSVLVSIAGFGKKDVWAELKALKGRRLSDWTENELREGVGLQQFIRGMIPTVGNRDKFKPIIDKLLAKKQDSRIKFTQDEFDLYCQNLVHTPDTMNEFIALRNLIPPEDRHLYNFLFDHDANTDVQ
jgi:nucleoside diphosphate kinase